MRTIIFYIFIIIILLGCKTKDTKSELYHVKYIRTLNDSLELAKIDTIICYQRTCIGCCDFYNFLYIKNGKKYFRKSHSDWAERNRIHYVDYIMEVEKIEPLNFLFDNIDSIESEKILDAGYQDENGIYNILSSNHYCYSKIDIKLGKREFSKEIKDSEIENISSNFLDSTKKINFNYKYNIKTKTNNLISSIETFLAIDADRECREYEILRKY